MVIPKLKAPGSFYILCLIGTMDFERALGDLGASVSLIPLSHRCVRVCPGEIRRALCTDGLCDDGHR